MRNLRSWAFSAFAVAALAIPANAQSVVSTHSGVIHFFEGAVYLGDQRLESHLGKFQSIARGEELRTAEGRAEVLLTPGVFLRMGELSAIRMVANDLADTQVELQAGSAIVDAAEPNSGTSVTLIYKDWKVRFLGKGIYRIDSDPPRVSVRQGEAEVFTGAISQPVSVQRGMVLPFASVLVPEQSGEQSVDALSDWADGRGESISADNAIAAQIDEDPASRTSGLDNFAYFPFLGVPALGLSSTSPYGAFNPYQSGFNSIYLPGYTYQPLLLGLMGRGYRTFQPLPIRRIGVLPGAGTFVPLPRPALPLTRPAVPLPRPAPVRVTPLGVHH